MRLNPVSLGRVKVMDARLLGQEVEMIVHTDIYREIKSWARRAAHNGIVKLS